MTDSLTCIVGRFYRQDDLDYCAHMDFVMEALFTEVVEALDTSTNFFPEACRDQLIELKNLATNPSLTAYI